MNASTGTNWRTIAAGVVGNILEWYKTADTKAQVILTANGTFLTV